MSDGSNAAKALPIVFALHDAQGDYWVNTAVAMTSVAKYARRPISIRIIHDETLTQVARTRLTEIAKALDTPLGFISCRMSQIDMGRFSPASLFRLAIPNVFPNEDLVVYLDSDLVANGVDVTEIADAAPIDAPLSAVVDPYITVHEGAAEQTRRLGLDPQRYFNSGVLALRPRLLATDLLPRFLEFRRSQEIMIHPDQEFLNLEFRETAGILPERFNTIIGDREGRALRPLTYYADKVVHYAARIKPMSGVICPAFIPFFAHSYLTPEIHMGSHYTPTRYLFPAPPPYTLNAKLIDQIP